MAASPPLWAVWTDVLWCLGIGMALAALRDVLSLVFGNSRPVCLVLDLTAFAAAAVLACGFAAGLSASGRVRWYMAAAMVLGAAGWYWALADGIHWLAGTLLRLLTWPMRLVSRRILAPARRRFRQWISRHKAQKSAGKRQKTQKKRKITLQNRGRVLYN